jgi:hypothetical protein
MVEIDPLPVSLAASVPWGRGNTYQLKGICLYVTLRQSKLMSILKPISKLKKMIQMLLNADFW